MNVMTRRRSRKGELKNMTTSIQKKLAKSTLATGTMKARAAKPSAHAAPSKRKPTRTATGGKERAPVRTGSKTAKIVELLKRSGGVILKDHVKATGWKPNSVRGFLSGTIGKKMGNPVASFKRADGDRAYRISSK
jgi:hypothetical protein